MAKSIKSILNKKNWTGKEVGKALLMSLKHDIENTGNPKKKPLFSQEDFNRMVDSLDTDYQYTQFKVLENIYGSIVESFNYTEANKQQFYSGYYRYLLSLEEARRAESFFTTTEKFPLILTQTQYDKIISERLAYKRGLTESYYSLFFHTVAFFIDAMENDKADTIPEDIRAAIISTQSQKVTNKRIIANWAEDTRAGYYTLPDGRRSDSMTSEEWLEAKKSQFMETHTFTIDGEEQDYPATARHLYYSQILQVCKLLFKGKEAIKEAYRKSTEKELSETDLETIEQYLEEMIDGVAYQKAVKAEDIIATNIYNTTWHYYTELPTDFTKYKVLTNMLGRYRGSHCDRLLEVGGEFVDEVPEREQFKEFKKDYPALADAIKSYLEGAVPTTKGLKANQLYKDLITWGELADISYLDFPNLLEISETDVIEHIAQTQEGTTKNLNRINRGLFHGIAIIKEAHLFDAETNGNYIDPVTDDFSPELLHGIDYLESKPDEAEDIQQNIDILALSALRYMYAFNAYIEIISSVFDIEFMTVAKCDTSKFENQIETTNNLLYMLYKDVYGTPEDKKRKRAFLRQYFKPVEIEELKPTKEAIEALKTRLESMGFSKEAAIALKHFKPLVFEIMRKEGASE